MEQPLINTTQNFFSSQHAKDWFDKVVGDLRTDQLCLETGIADQESRTVYKALITGEETSLHSMLRSSSSFYFTKSILIEYLKNLEIKKDEPFKLSFDYTDAKVLVWAEIEDDDEVMEDRLIIAQAKTNAKFYEYGFSISTTIVEKGDRITKPPHYTNFF